MQVSRTCCLNLLMVSCGVQTLACGRPGDSKICWKYSEVLILSGAGVSSDRRVTRVLMVMLPASTLHTLFSFVTQSRHTHCT